MITIRHQIELESIFLVTMAAGVSLFFVMHKNNYQPQFSVASGIPTVQAPTEVISPKVTLSSQISPDGTKKVILKVTENNNDTKTYDFSVSDENGASELFIFTKTLDSSKTMTIPFNTWSPDNKYFFIQENAEGSKKILVFEGSGAPFTTGEAYLDATDLFEKQNTGNNFAEATGWASETLIIINTKKQDNTKGFSYWFELPSKAIIQLSTEF